MFKSLTMNSLKCPSLFVALTMTVAMQAQTDRDIVFDSIENARELGGLVMTDGRTVKQGLLLRCGNLSMASEADLQRLKDDYHLSLVVDFRTSFERNVQPDRIMEGVERLEISTLPPEMEFPVSKQKVDDLDATIFKLAFTSIGKDIAMDLYPSIVTCERSQRYYGCFLDAVLEAKGSVLWHCTQGKDRAGIGAALLLAALGADEETLVADFERSNVSYAAQIDSVGKKVKEKGGGDAEMAVVYSLVGVNTTNFRQSLGLIKSLYGSLDQYLGNQLGFGPEKQQRLREKYLE